MNEHERTDGAEDVVARLRAADPARGARVDLPTLWAAVEARRGDQAGPRGAPGADDHGPGLVVVDELAARRRARTAWPAKIAAAAASVLLVGGGGYALGLGAGSAVVADGPASQEATPETASEGDVTMAYEPQGGGSVPTEMTEDGKGGGDSSVVSSDVAASMPYGYWQRVVFTASGLSADATSAQVYGLDASAVATEERVAQLAGALGVAGEVRFNGYAWQVGPEDGSSPRVDLYASGDASLSYYDASVDTYDCPVWVEGASEEYLERPCVERDLGPAPSEEEGAARAAELLTALGYDPADFRIGVPDWYDGGYEASGSSYLTVEARPFLDGQRLDQVWSFSFTGGGLQSMYGPVAEIVPLGEYPVISPAEAVARLGDPRFAGGGWLGPVDTVAGSPLRAAMSGQEYVAGEPTVPATPTAGAAVSWPVSNVTLTSAELSLTTHYQNDGAVLLVPSYRLYSDDGGIWQVIAVADSALDFSDGR